MKSLSKNKYAKSKRARLKPFMHKVDVWLPTKTYNKLRDLAMVNGQDIEQLAANGLYRTINGEPQLLYPWAIPTITDVSGNLQHVVDILGKFILATLKTGIHQDDVMMNGLDSNLSYEEIVRSLNQMSEGGLFEVDSAGIIRYKYYSPIEKKQTLSRFKGKKVDSKVKATKPKIEPLVKKQRRTK